MELQARMMFYQFWKAGVKMSDKKSYLAVFPSKAELQVIVSDEEIYRKYMDTLMLMHDKLIEFSEANEPPRFTVREREKSMKHLLNGTGALKPILNTVLRNWETAKILRNQAEESKTPEEIHASTQKVTAFLDSVLDIYRTVRLLNKYKDSDRDPII